MNSAKAAAVVFEEPGKLAIRQVSLNELSPKIVWLILNGQVLVLGLSDCYGMGKCLLSWTRLPISSWI